MKASIFYKPNLAFIKNPIPQEKKRVAGRQGGLIRTIARRSIRKIGKRKTPAMPGKPPKSRTGLLRNAIFYSWDATTQSVVVGPQKLPLPGKTPKVLEVGGRNKNQKGVATYQARPFMGPALQKAKDKLPELWAGAIKG